MEKYAGLPVDVEIARSSATASRPLWTGPWARHSHSADRRPRRAALVQGEGLKTAALFTSHDSTMPGDPLPLAYHAGPESASPHQVLTAQLSSLSAPPRRAHQRAGR